MKTLTPLQIEVLLILANDECHDGCNPIGNPLYSHGMFLNKKHSGAVASCVKAGYIESFEDGPDSTLALTMEGAKMLEQSGYFLSQNSMCFLAK